MIVVAVAMLLGSVGFDALLAAGRAAVAVAAGKCAPRSLAERTSRRLSRHAPMSLGRQCGSPFFAISSAVAGR
jgi:hypothetical protein